MLATTFESYLKGAGEGLIFLIKMILPLIWWFVGVTISSKCDPKKWKAFLYSSVAAIAAAFVFGRGNEVSRSGGDLLFDAGEVTEVREVPVDAQKEKIGRYFIIFLIPAALGVLSDSANYRGPRSPGKEK